MPPASKLNNSLPKLARELASNGPHKAEHTLKRIRLLHNGQYVADSTAALAVWETPYYPQYYLPHADFQSKFVTNGEEIKAESGEGEAVARLLTIDVNGKSTEQAFEMLQGKLKGYVKVLFGAMDMWLEEDTPIFVHPKDPYKRIDIIQSRRRIRVLIEGKVVADTTFSVHLYETGLPVRYYMPLTAVDQSLLRPSTSTSVCPYKGTAEYYSIVVDGKEATDVVWYYDKPLIESAAIVGLVCFYNEKVDIEIDGVKQQRAESVWS